jgi:hypothetical protein
MTAYTHQTVPTQFVEANTESDIVAGYFIFPAFLRNHDLIFATESL